MSIRSKDPALITELPAVIVGGPTGLLGPAGATGLEGPPAVTGATGLAGELGPVGVTGPTGINSPTGPMGPRGETGPQRFDDTGPTGYYGDDGPIGPTGPTGATGITGQGGPRGGHTGAPSILTGPTGASAIAVTQFPFFADPDVFLTVPLLVGFENSSRYWSQSVNSIQMEPIYVPYARTFTQIAVEFWNSYNYLARFRLGIYDCDETMHPTVPLFDSGHIAPPVPLAQARIVIPMNVALKAKPYYLAYWNSGTAMTLKMFESVQTANTLGIATRYFSSDDNVFFQTHVGGLALLNQPYGPAFPDLTSRTLSGGAIPVMGIR